MDKFGRRPLLLFGSIAMTICRIIIAVLVGLYHSTWAQHKDKGWVSVAFLFVYMLAFGMTWGMLGDTEWNISILTPSRSSSMGNAVRDLPQLIESEKRRLEHLQQLAKQFHHRPDYAAADLEH